MTTAIILPDIGVREEAVRVSCWLVDPGDRVEPGDRVVEVLVRGMTFDVAAERAGVLSRIEKPFDAPVEAGEVLGWIEEDS